MQDEFIGRLRDAHFNRAPADPHPAPIRVAARLRAVPYLAERIAGQLAVAFAAVSIASTLTLTTGLA